MFIKSLHMYIVHQVTEKIDWVPVYIANSNHLLVAIILTTQGRAVTKKDFNDKWH